MVHFYARFPPSRGTSRLVLGFKVIFNRGVFPPKYTRLPDCRAVVSCSLSLSVHLGQWMPPPPLLLVLVPLFAAVEMFVCRPVQRVRAVRMPLAYIRRIVAYSRRWRRRVWPCAPDTCGGGGGGICQLADTVAGAARAFRWWWPGGGGARASENGPPPPRARFATGRARRPRRALSQCTRIAPWRSHDYTRRPFVSKRDLFIINFK